MTPPAHQNLVCIVKENTLVFHRNKIEKDNMVENIKISVL